MSGINTRPRVVLVNRAFILNKGKILIIKRQDNDSHNALLWEVPGGKMEKGEDISMALEKEVLEETNLAIQPIDKIAFYTSTILSTGKYKGLNYIELYGIAKALSNKVILSSEHTDYKWVSLKDLQKHKLTLGTQKAFVNLEKRLKLLVQRYQ